MTRGFFEIGIFHGKTEHNLGTLWRTAFQMGAAGIFTIGQRYRAQASDTYKADRHIPMRQYRDFDEFQAARPEGCQLIGIEMGGTPLNDFKHPQRAVYLLGAEDGGIPSRIIERCQHTISLPNADGRPASYNVAVAGALVMAHRNWFQR